MSIVELSHIVKSFGPVRAVDDVSFSLEKGELFGLLGPNGAGKTTSLRVMLDIFKPDRGSVTILDGPMSEAKKDRIGYMPEERGLYQDIPLERCLLYLGSLKGLSPSDGKRRVGEFLERFDLAEHKNKKIKELSKGMQQKAQVAATLLHQPELLIVDEPFSGLDPVNTRVIKEVLLEQHEQGATIILCSHQMHQVEELCDRIVLIDHGNVMLYGDLTDIRHRFSGNAILVRTTSPIPSLTGVERMESQNGTSVLHLASGTDPQAILQELVASHVTVEQFELAVPTLDEIFIRVVKGQGVTQ
jgi:ABC-2 type transport system ATP-binding protein